MQSAEIFNSPYRKSLLVVVLSFCICGYYLPWEWTSFLLIPLYLFAWVERANYQVEKKLKIAFLVFIGYILFFSLTSYVPKHSFKGAYDVLRGLLLFPVGLAFARLVTDRKYWACVNFVALLLVLGSLLFPQRGGQFYSYFENPNNAAVLLIVFISLLFPPVATWRPRLLNFFSVVGLPIALYLLFLTNGRGSWLGFAVAIITLLLFRSNLRSRYRLTVSLVIGAGLALLLFKYNRKGFQLSEREGLWSGLFMQTIEKNLYFGYGFNGTKDFIDQLGLITRTAHNVFLEIFVTSGLFGLIFILIFVFYLWRTFSHYSYPNNHLIISSLFVIIALLVMGQFDLKFSSFQFVGTIALFLGMIYSQRIEKQKENNGRSCD